MQLEFKYCGKEINKEDFNKLNDVFKWVTNTTVNSVDFNSVFDGKYKSMIIINDHIKSLGLLPIELSKSDCNKVEKEIKNTVFSDFIKKSLLTKGFDPSRGCWFYDMPISAEKVKKEEILTDKEQNHLSTRHKSQKGETHNKVLVNMFNTIDPKEYEYISLGFTPKLNQEQVNLLNKVKGIALEEGIKFAKDEAKIEEKNSVINKEELQSYNLYDNPNYLTHLGKELKGVKESQTTQKAPIFTYCKVNKNALEELSLRALYGHLKYNKNGADEDWQNFTRVANAEEEYANAQFRHALQIGKEENEKEHLVSSAWNAISRLEIYLRKNLQDKK